MIDNEAVLLHDLAQLRLQEGKKDEAEEVIRQALDLRDDDSGACAQSELTEAADEEDDWETAGWEDHQAACRPAHSAAQRSESAATQQRQQPGTTAALAQQQHQCPPFSGDEEAAAVPVPFGGQHILEIYGLSTKVTTNDLERFLESCSSGPIQPVVRWVDDAHALAVFRDPAAARSGLQMSGLKYKLRPFSEASSGARQHPGRELQPPKARPKTSAAVARRMIGSALNMGSQLRDKSGEKELAAERKARADARRQKQQALEAAWED